MAEMEPQKDGMDVLEAWLDRYNAAARPAIPLDSGGEAGGAQLRLKYAPADGMVAILHLVAVSRGGRPVILVNRFEGPTAETSGGGGVWGGPPVGRRPGGGVGTGGGGESRFRWRSLAPTGGT